MHALVKKARALLKGAGSLEVRAASPRFFKEPVNLHGVKGADAKAILKQTLAELKTMDKEEVFDLADQLWKSGYLEECSMACEWAYSRRGEFAVKDMDVFERWIDEYVTNWANCDVLCNHSVGALVEMYPELAARLREWTGSDSRWKKRAAAVSLIIPARKGLFLDDVFYIADRLLDDPDDLVRKGYGWMLKAASEAHLKPVYEYVMGKKTSMPRTAFRYAIEKMPKELRAKAMKKP